MFAGQALLTAAHGIFLCVVSTVAGGSLVVMWFADDC
jgi:hypothetical protein